MDRMVSFFQAGAFFLTHTVLLSFGFNLKIHWLFFKYSCKVCLNPNHIGIFTEFPCPFQICIILFYVYFSQCKSLGQNSRWQCCNYEFLPFIFIYRRFNHAVQPPDDPAAIMNFHFLCLFAGSVNHAVRTPGDQATNLSNHFFRLIADNVRDRLSDHQMTMQHI
jgi:hypothetical protein